MFFSFRLAFRYFSCHGQPTYNAHRTALSGLALFRIGNLVLILRRERSEGSLALPTRPPIEIPKSFSSRYRLIPRWTFKTQRLRPLCGVVDEANLAAGGLLMLGVMIRVVIKWTKALTTRCVAQFFSFPFEFDFRRTYSSQLCIAPLISYHSSSGFFCLRGVSDLIRQDATSPVTPC